MRGRCSSSLCKFIEGALRLLFLLSYMGERYFLEEVKALFVDSFYYADVAWNSLGFS